jgi:hypothetical protein
MATTESLRASLSAFIALPYPRRLFGEVVAGIELAELDPHIVGLVSQVATGSRLATADRAALSVSAAEAARVAQHLIGDERSYFEALSALGAAADEIAG